MISIKIIAFFLKIWEKVMLVVTIATDIAINIFTIFFLVLSGNDHSVKVSSNSEVGSGTALWEFFGFLRELVLSRRHIMTCVQDRVNLTSVNKLLLQWKGPYEVVEIANRMDYRVDIGRVVGTYHANLLKQYIERLNVVSHCLMCAEANVMVDEETEEIGLDNCAFLTATVI